MPETRLVCALPLHVHNTQNSPVSALMLNFMRAADLVPIIDFKPHRALFQQKTGAGRVRVPISPRAGYINSLQSFSPSRLQCVTVAAFVFPLIATVLKYCSFVYGPDASPLWDAM